MGGSGAFACGGLEQIRFFDTQATEGLYEFRSSATVGSKPALRSSSSFERNSEGVPPPNARVCYTDLIVDSDSVSVSFTDL